MEQTTKRRKIFYITAFTIAVLFVVLICCNFTLAYFGGVLNNSSNIVMANMNMTVTYSLDFDDVLLPNRVYSDAEKYSLKITGGGSAGDMYIRVLMETNIDGHIEPLLSSPTQWSNGGTNPNEYYYLSKLTSGTMVNFMKGFRTKNTFDNSLKGKEVEVSFKVYAIQADYGAVTSDLSWIVDAPSEFKALVGYVE